MAAVLTDETLVHAKQVTKVYHTGEVDTYALRGIDLEVKAGDFLAIVGPSGSGKTTLLNLIGALDNITDGTLEVLGSDVSRMSRRQRADLRLHALGFIFQAYNLFPVLTAQENVQFVLELQGVNNERGRRAREVLDRLGLGEYANRRPPQMSGGQQQRVAVARAVASKPRLVLADEPTANLDSQTGAEIIALMRRLQRERGASFVFSSHDPMVLAQADDVVRIRDGRIDAIEHRDTCAEVAA